MNLPSERQVSLWRALMSPLQKHRLQLLLTLLAGVLAQAATLVCTLMTGWLCTRVLAGDSPHALLFPAGVIALSVVVMSLARWALAWLSHDLAFALIETLQMGIFDGLARATPGRTGQQRLGDIAATATSDAELMERFYAHLLIDYLTAFLMPCLAIIALLVVAPMLCLILLPCIVLLMLAPLLTSRRAKQQGLKVAEKKSVLNTHIVELVQGWRDIQMFGAEGRYRATLQQANRQLTQAQRRYGARSGLEQALLDGLVALSLIVMLLASYPLFAFSGRPSTWMPFIVSIAAAAIFPLSDVLHVGGQWGALKASAERIFTLQQLQDSVEDHPANTLPQGHRIAFEGVSFSYPNSSEKVLDDINLVIEPGEKVALAGPSGSGKTTLACLLLRFYDPDAGQIFLGETNIAALSLETLRGHIAWASQESWLFHDTLENNIRLGFPGATLAQIKQAAQLARADAFIRELPQGYQTICLNGGENFSGGQRQRIALARALVSQAPVILLDETSAGLDSENEQLILEALISLPANRTMIMIAHRLPILARADRVITLDKGRITAWDEASLPQ